MPTTVWMYDPRDFAIDFRNGDGTTVYTSAPTGDQQDINIPYSQQITGGTLSMGGTLADVGSLDINFISLPLDTAISSPNGSGGTVATGKTLFGDTTIGTNETVQIIYEIYIYDPAAPSTQIALYAVARTDNYDGSSDGNHVIIGFATEVPLDPNVTYVVGDVYDNSELAVRENNSLSLADLTPDPGNPICFASGTKIMTDRGEICVEDLQSGDLIATRDSGLQPIRWIGSRRLSTADLERRPALRPIRIRAGALGGGTPHTDLVVSPQHRVLLRSQIADRMFGEKEVLVAAKQLLSIKGIEVAEDFQGVTYFHFLLDSHQVVISNGAETESLFTGPEALKSVGSEARAEIFALFPELRDMEYCATPARPFSSGQQVRKLVHRHVKQHKPLVAESHLYGH